MVALRCSLDEKPGIVLQTLRGYAAGAKAVEQMQFKVAYAKLKVNAFAQDISLLFDVPHSFFKTTRP
jgi:hypothetical protein